MKTLKNNGNKIIISFKRKKKIDYKMIAIKNWLESLKFFTAELGESKNENLIGEYTINQCE